MKLNLIGEVLTNVSENDAVEYLHNYDFSADVAVPGDIKYAQYVESAGDIDLYYDFGADYYFFAVSDDAVENYQSK